MSKAFNRLNIAEVVEDAIRVIDHDRISDTLTVPAPNGWDDVRPLTARVLRFNGVHYTFSGWNSDRNVAYFKRSQSIAEIVR